MHVVVGAKCALTHKSSFVLMTKSNQKQYQSQEDNRTNEQGVEKRLRRVRKKSNRAKHQPTKGPCRMQ